MAVMVFSTVFKKEFWPADCVYIFGIGLLEYILKEIIKSAMA